MTEFTFDLSFNDFEEKNKNDLQKLIEFSFNSKIYLSLISIDFTYLNSKFGLEPGNKLKELVINLLNLRVNSGEILYFSSTSSKFFIFTKDKIDLKIKIELDNISKLVETKYNFDFAKKRVIYIIENNNKNSFSFGPFTQNNIENSFKSNFLFAYNFEKKLNFIRLHFQEYYNKIEELDISNFENDLKELEDISNSYHTYLNIYKLNKINSNFFGIDVKNLKNSFYLNKAYELYLNYKNNQHDLLFAYEYLIKYIIWLKIQEVLFINFKYEKIFFFFGRESNTHKINKNNIVNFSSKDDLLLWFESTVKLFIPVMDLKNKKSAFEIEKLIKTIDLENINDLKKLRDIVELLFDNFTISGMFNLPLEKIKPSNFAKEFFTNQMYYNFGSNYKEMFKIWLNYNFVKKPFYTSVEKPKQLFDANLFMNQSIISNLEDFKIHICFLELDGFNSLNNFYFPSDLDQIVYSKILDIIYINMNKRIEKNPNSIFKTALFSFLGDEFFLTFLSKNNLNHIEKNEIESFYKDVKLDTLNEFYNLRFPESKKIYIKLKNNSIISFRKILKNESSFLGLKNTQYDFKIAEFGVSGVYIHNLNFNSYDINKFDLLIDNLDSTLTNYIKNSTNNKGKIFELNYKFQLISTNFF